MNHPLHHQQRPYSANAACAACKHQRKKCDERCLLSPYFPADKSREFQAVHRVFGVSNVTKMMLAVSEADRARLKESLVWEALMRQRDPVLGIYGEYQKILDELLYFKNLAQNHAVQMQQLQAEINRIGTNNSIINSSVPVPVPVTVSSGLVVWNRGNNPGANLGRAGEVSVTANEGPNKMTQVLRESESCIIDAIPYTCGIQNHLQIKNENQEREVASPAVVSLPPSPPRGGYKQQYYISGTSLGERSLIFNSTNI